MLITILIVICLIPFIAYLDYHLFSKYAKCPHCKLVILKKKWHVYIIPTTIEILMLMAGIGIGLLTQIEVT